MKRLAASILLLLLPVLAGAQASPLIVQNAWIRATPGSDTAAAYLVLRNTGVEPIIVIGVKSPAANHVMIHETTTKSGMSQMRMHEKLVIAPGQSVTLSPGGMHVMLSGLKKSLLIGQTVPLVLLLANGGTVQTAVIVKPLDAQ